MSNNANTKQLTSRGHAGPIALGNEAKKLVDYGNHVERLRRAANETVQCADCLAWIRRDGSHTCKQQIKQNRKVRK